MTNKNLSISTLFITSLHDSATEERRLSVEYVMQAWPRIGKKEKFYDSLLIQEIADTDRIPSLLFTSSSAVYFIPQDITGSFEDNVDQFIRIGRSSLSDYSRVTPDTYGMFMYEGDDVIFNPDKALGEWGNNPTRQPWHTSTIVGTRFLGHGSVIGYEVVLARHLFRAGIIDELRKVHVAG